MARLTKSITFSVPPDMAVRVDEVMKEQGRSRSDLLREALVRYIEECEWRGLLEYGEQQAKSLGIDVDEVAPLVEEYRAEMLREVSTMTDSRMQSYGHKVGLP